MIDVNMVPCKACYNSYEIPSAEDVGLCGECLDDLAAGLQADKEANAMVKLFTMADWRRPAH